MADKRVFARIRKAKGGHRVSLWRSSDNVLTSEVLEIGVARIKRQLQGLEKAIQKHGITITTVDQEANKVRRK